LATFDTGTNTIYFRNPLGLNSNGVNSTGGIKKMGDGTLILGGPNVYSGSTSITAGVLNIRDEEAIGSSSSILVYSQGVLELEHVSGMTVGYEALSLDGGRLRNKGGFNTWEGTIALNAWSSIESYKDNITLNATTAIIGKDTNLSLQGDGNGLVSGIIATGTGSLAKYGAGKWILAGSNTFAGPVTINAGVLNVQNDQGTGMVAGAGRLHHKLVS
jgi:autotransporter-associated beta strand protein